MVNRVEGIAGVGDRNAVEVEAVCIERNVRVGEVDPRVGFADRLTVDGEAIKDRSERIGDVCEVVAERDVVDQ